MSAQVFSTLLVGRNVEDAWVKRLQSYLAGYGAPDLAQKSQTIDQLSKKQYDLIFLDEITLLGDYGLIEQILQAQPATKVVVVTGATDWRRARQAFQHRAWDYVSTDKPEEIMKVVQEATSLLEQKGEG